MPLQNFVAKAGPPISAVWLNQVDTLKYTIFSDATTKAEARTNLTSDAPLEVANGGTGTRGVGASFLVFLASFFPSLYQYINPLAPGEIAGSVTDYSYLPGDVRRCGFNGDNGVTDNTAAIQNTADASAGRRPVIIPNMGGYGKHTNVNLPANTTLIIEGAALQCNSAASPALFTIAGDNVEIQNRGGSLTFNASMANSNIITGVGRTNVKIRNGSLIGNLSANGTPVSAGNGIFLSRCNDVEVDLTSVTQCPQGGIRIDG